MTEGERDRVDDDVVHDLRDYASRHVGLPAVMLWVDARKVLDLCDEVVALRSRVTKKDEEAGTSEKDEDRIDGLARYLLNDDVPISDRAWRICEQADDMREYARRALAWFSKTTTSLVRGDMEGAYRASWNVGQLDWDNDETTGPYRSEWRRRIDAAFAALGRGRLDRMARELAVSGSERDARLERAFAVLEGTTGNGTKT